MQFGRECREGQVFVNIDNIVRMRGIDSLRRLRIGGFRGRILGICALCVFCLFCRFCAFGSGEANPVLLGELEECADGYACAVGVEAAVVLSVAFLRGIAAVETADSVVGGASAFAEGIGEGESEGSPVGVAGGDVGARRFNTLCDEFDVIFWFRM